MSVTSEMSEMPITFRFVPSTQSLHSNLLGSLVTSNRDQGPCSYPGKAKASANAAN